MVLSFGSGMLFNTAEEETYKGVFGDRLEDEPTAGSAIVGLSYVSAAWTDVPNSEVTVSVKPGEKVLVMASADFLTLTAGEIISARIVRGASTGVTNNPSGGVLAVNNVLGNLVPMGLDDPGEGVHVYTVQAQSTDDGSGTILSCKNMAFVVGARR